MALTLSQIGIETTNTVEAWHVTQSIDAFTGTEAYDITLSGSLTIDGLTTQRGQHAQGLDPQANGNFSHAEGNATIANGDYAHAEGATTTAEGESSHAEGRITLASGPYSHAEGTNTQAIGGASHAEGENTISSGSYSHAEGYTTIALGDYSHAEGLGTISSGIYQHVLGQYNKYEDTTSLFIVGNGISDDNRKDAFKVRMSGSIILPNTQSAAPSWTGVDGEMIPATVAGQHFLFMWMNGGWKKVQLA
jgi:hypothetical protein